MEIVEATNGYSRLLAWEVWNFMSIEHGKAEFDERNIVNFKGYNDSGKSAMLRALDVLISNIKPSKQVNFIQDDKDYFRIIAYFSDGVSILRDKYINGQSLYEMYKDNECIFTTKSGKALSAVSEVPQPIQDYLGLITWDKDVLNSRSCFEKQIGVQTSGSDNYKMFNTVLKSEEIASASAMLNTDKNKLLSDMNSIDADIAANKALALEGSNLTEGMITYLKEHDAKLDDFALAERSLIIAGDLMDELAFTPVIPEVPAVSTESFDALCRIVALSNELHTIRVTPEVASVDVTQMDELTRLRGMVEQLNSIPDYIDINSIDISQINTLTAIGSLIEDFDNLETDITNIDLQLEELSDEVKNCEELMKQFGVKMITCPNCGKLFDPEEACC